MFNNIDINIDWGFLFGFVSVFSILITAIYKIINKKTKEISVENVNIEKILYVPNELKNELKILYQNTEIDSLNKINVYLFNNGSYTLNVKDFHINPTINLRGFSNMMKINVFTSNEFTEIQTEKIGGSKVILMLKDFEPKTYIHIEILFESINNDFEPYFEVCLKEKPKINKNLSSISIDKEFSLDSQYKSTLNNALILGLITLVMTYLVVKYGFGIDFSNFKNFSIGWKIIFFMPAIVATTITFIKLYVSTNNWYIGWSKINKWYNKSA